MTQPNFSYDTIVIGGGQAGLATGYHLQRQGREFVILDASQRTGDPWRQRWDSLRLFTPARYCALPGLPFPADDHYFPTKDEMVDYLAAYAAHFDLPVRTGHRVDRLAKSGRRYLVEANGRRFEADNVVVAMGNYQKPAVPAFAAQLAGEIVQLHASDYRNLSQLQAGDVLLVGAGNSGAEIALETATAHKSWLSGRHPGHIPFRIDGWAARLFLVWFVLRVLFFRVLTMSTPVGRRFRAKLYGKGGPLVRTKPADLAAAGVERVARMTGVEDGRPLLGDGRVLDVANVIWCTGYTPGFSWIDLPGLDVKEPQHERGVAAGQPGLYFVGLRFLYAASSEQIQGVGRDAAYVVEHIAARAARPSTAGRSEIGPSGVQIAR